MPVSRKRRRVRTKRPTPAQLLRRNRLLLDRVLNSCPSCAAGLTVPVTVLLTAETASLAGETASYTSAFLGDLSGSTDRP
jgi:hypothetical protein